MASSHVGITLEDIRKEQDTIDKLVDKLLNTDVSSSDCGTAGINSSIVKTPVPAKRGRGRPSKSVPVSSPLTRPVTEKQPTDFAVLFDCINSINSQNKRLLQYVQALNDKVESKDSKDLSTKAENSVVPPSTDPIVAERLERIEQNLNSNILLCRGPQVPNLINQVKVGSTVNYEGLKGNLCRAICGEDVTEIDIKNLRVSVVGREKKAIKIDCSNSFSRVHILKQARRKRPAGVYVSEYLSKAKLSTFNKLRALRRLHPDKIKSIYTKEGNIFYRGHGTERPILVKSDSDLVNIFPSASIPPGAVEGPVGHQAREEASPDQSISGVVPVSQHSGSVELITSGTVEPGQLPQEEK